MKIIHKCRVLHDGWELDNSLWVVENEDGSREIQTTNHGMKCGVDREELDHKIKETQESLDGLIAAKKLCR